MENWTNRFTSITKVLQFNMIYKKNSFRKLVCSFCYYTHKNLNCYFSISNNCFTLIFLHFVLIAKLQFFLCKIFMKILLERKKLMKVKICFWLKSLVKVKVAGNFCVVWKIKFCHVNLWEIFTGFWVISRSFSFG